MKNKVISFSFNEVEAMGRAALLCTLLLWMVQVCSSTITVKVDPKLEVNGGGAAKLPCTYSGSSLKDDLIEWYTENDGGRIRVAFRKTSGEVMIDTTSPLFGRVSLGKDYTLTITDVKPSDQLTFYCQVTAGKDGSGEGYTKLEVFVAPEKPEIQKTSQGISVKAEKSSEIATCKAMNGFPSSRIIWFKDNLPLPEVKDTREKTYMVLSTVKEASGLYTMKSVLYMRPTKADKDSMFHCTVEYSLAGEKNKNIQLKSDSIKIDLQYSFENVMFSVFNATAVKEGDDVILKCETDGNPQPMFDFTKDQKTLTAKGGLLTLKNVQRSDSGKYVCSATDFGFELMEKQQTTILDVNFIEKMSVTPNRTQDVMLGNKVEWQCKTKASKNHTVHWKKGSTVLSQDGTLSFDSVSYKHAGEYVCVGAVPEVPGLTAQANVSLIVRGIPEIESPLAVEVTKEGDEVTLRCSANGVPPPQITWTPSGKESISVEDNKVVSTLTLKATPEIMEKGVRCEVSNKYGTDSKTLSVNLKRADKQQGGSSAVVVAVVVCVLLLLLLVALIYFLSKKTTFCSKEDKKEAATGQVNNIVVEMKTDKANEEAGLLNKKVNTEQ